MHIVNADAFGWLEQSAERVFDVIVIDFPDPSNFALGKLYSASFYALVDQHLAAGGFAVIQTTSPSLPAELLDGGDHGRIRRPHDRALLTPTCRALANGASRWPRAGPFTPPRQLPEGLRFLESVQSLPTLFDFPPDMARVTDRGEPVVQPGVGSRIRGRMGSCPFEAMDHHLLASRAPSRGTASGPAEPVPRMSLGCARGSVERGREAA